MAGLALGWALTYFFMTREKRIIRKVASAVTFLSGYHNLNKNQYISCLHIVENVSGEWIIDLYKMIKNKKNDELTKKIYKNRNTRPC